MNYQSLYDFIHDISQNMDQTVKFFHGRKEMLIQTTPDEGLFAFCLPFTSTGSTVGGAQINETWEVNIIFYMRDNPDSSIDQNDQDVIQDEIRTLTITEQSANRFLRLVHGNAINDSLEAASEKLSINSFSKSNAIKDTAQLLTGTLLTLSLIVPDDFDYCTLPNLISGDWEAGNALLFDGVNDLISLDNSLDLNNFTFSCWFNSSDAFAAAGFLFSKEGAAGNQNYLGFGGATVVQLKIDGVTHNFTVPVMAVDTWYHLMVTRSSTSAKVYLNGVESTTGTIVVSSAVMPIKRFGAFQTDILTWGGKLDDYYFWDVIGSLEDSVSLYNGGIPVDPESVIPDATYKYLFNESEGINLPDTGASENNGTLTNFADPDSNWVSRL